MWRNIHQVPITENQRARWHKITHDIIATNLRLNTINMSSTNKCRNCEEIDTTIHIIGTCNEGARCWDLTLNKIARILRTIPRNIPTEWTIYPECDICPKTRHRAVLRLLAQQVSFRLTQTEGDTICDYVTYGRRNKARIYQHKNRRKMIANYLCVEDE
jgi:hypothetical protein